MNYGYIKVGAFTKKVKVGDVDFNKNQIIEGVKEANSKGVKLLVFPELSLTGYTAGELFSLNALTERCDVATKEILSNTNKYDVVFVYGMPYMYNSRLYDVAVVVSKGKILGIVPKTNLSNYNELYEGRWFAEPSNENVEVNLAGFNTTFGSKLIFECSTMSKFKFACEFGSDLTSISSPSIKHSINGANVIACLSCMTEMVGKADFIRQTIISHSAKIISGYVYAEAGDGESTSDAVFAGQNIVCENGVVLSENKLFENGLIVSEIDIDYLLHERIKKIKKDNSSCYTNISFDLEVNETKLSRYYTKTPFVSEDKNERNQRAELILSMQATGLKTRIEHTYAKSVVIGLSGGLDSTLALLVAYRAINMLGRSPKDIIGVTMPCFGTTSRTLTNTIMLAKNLGITLKKIDISKAVTKHLKDIKHDLNTYDVTFENAQARERTQVIMDISNMSNGFVVGTGDLSELALGWATYNGDHMSMYGVNASIPKTLVRHLVHYVAINSKPKLKTILFDILDTPVSPELLPAVDDQIAQKTEEIVGPYVLHDFYLYAFVRLGFSPKKIFKIAKYVFENDFDDETILKWLKIFIKRFFTQQFKRSCVPDGVKVGTVALSPRGDWKMPSDAHFKLWLDELNEI